MNVLFRSRPTTAGLIGGCKALTGGTNCSPGHAVECGVGRGGEGAAFHVDVIIDADTGEQRPCSDGRCSRPPEGGPAITWNTIACQSAAAAKSSASNVVVAPIVLAVVIAAQTQLTRLELTASELAEIDTASAGIEVQGARYPEATERLIDS
jgi:hypothetical protein